MSFKKIFHTILYPHIGFMIALSPVSICLLVAALVFNGGGSIAAFIAYPLSAYTLTVWCFRIPNIINFFGEFKSNNKYMKRWLTDPALRVSALARLLPRVRVVLFACYILYLPGSYAIFPRKIRKCKQAW